MKRRSLGVSTWRQHLALLHQLYQHFHSSSDTTTFDTVHYHTVLWNLTICVHYMTQCSLYTEVTTLEWCLTNADKVLCRKELCHLNLYM